MRRQDLIAFARRDWAAIAELKDEHRRARRRRESALEIFSAVDALRAQVHAQRADYPSPSERDADLASHVLVYTRRTLRELDVALGDVERVRAFDELAQR